jgi:hypothetical protein
MLLRLSFNFGCLLSFCAGITNKIISVSIEFDFIR